MKIAVLHGDEVNAFTGLTDLGKDKPKVLWVAGEVQELELENCVAVVGTRKMTNYGLRAVSLLVQELINRGKMVVSGYMSGVDMAVHKATLEKSGRGVAVLGWGIDNQFTNSKVKIPNNLYNNLAGELVAKGGLVVSEWESQPGTIWTFPRRNRLVAAMSSEVYVVEATLDSGSLITADWAVKLKRKLFAIPGPITSLQSEGTNKLIADGKAQIWIPHLLPKVDVTRYTNYMDIYTMLQNDISTLDEIVRHTGRSPEDLSRQLTLMELEGLVRRVGGRYELRE